jgi:site-specific recombinase XerD
MHRQVLAGGSPESPAPPPSIDRRVAPLLRSAAARRGQRPPNYGKTYPPEVLSNDELRRLLLATPRSGPIGARNRALIAVLWRCGLRVAEAGALLPKDIDFDRKTLVVLRGKGCKRRLLGLDDLTAELVKVWLGVRQALGIDDSRPLFCVVMGEYRGGPMRPQLVNSLLKNLAVRANVHKRVHPHGFRHTGAFDLAEAGMPMHQLKAVLGHGSLRQTERYISHLAPIAIVQSMSVRPWPSTVAAAITDAAGVAS